MNRYQNTPKNVYYDLYNLVRDKDYFVLTTNVDHFFKKQGLISTGYFIHRATMDYGNVQSPATIKPMITNPSLKKWLPNKKMRIPSELVPHCPVCGAPMAMNLRTDNTLVEDKGWHRAAGRYQTFISRHKDLKIVYLELGVGGNTPGIRKYPFWRMIHEWKNAEYICINAKESYAPEEIRDSSICIQADIGEVLQQFMDSDS